MIRKQIKPALVYIKIPAAITAAKYEDANIESESSQQISIYILKTNIPADKNTPIDITIFIASDHLRQIDGRFVAYEIPRYQ